LARRVGARDGQVASWLGRGSRAVLRGSTGAAAGSASGQGTWGWGRGRPLLGRLPGACVGERRKEERGERREKRE
jgi:hypothetical protein